MKTATQRHALALAGICLLTVYGCGGGGGSNTPDTPPAQIAPAASTLEGTAATGAALANASVAITDATSSAPCEQTTITTSALGSYTCTLKSGRTAPFFIVVTDPTGNTPAMVSVQTTTPAAGAKLTVNVTPLTTAILAQLSSDGNPLSVVAAKSVDVPALTSLTANIVAQLANVLTAIGAPAGYNPFTTAITAASAAGVGNTADLVLDVVRIAVNPVTGGLALSTVDNPTPVALATATAAGGAMPTPAAGISTLAQALPIAAKAFNACFAVPTSQRVTGVNLNNSIGSGGISVTGVIAECKDIAASTSNAAGIEFVHNGYSSGQFFYGLLTATTMTGAQFSVPEIMLYLPATATTPEQAVVNIRFVDANGNAGNVITVARRIAGSSSATRPTEWWLAGNQQLVDTSVRTQVRRVEQFNPNVTMASSPNRISTFQSGLIFSVNQVGPGTTGIGFDVLQLARISGPGLPGNGAAGSGLVYVRSTGTQLLMDFFNKTGSLTVGSQCGNNTTFNCPNIWFSRTQGISGSAATTLGTNQVNVLWAQPADGFNPALAVKGSRYTIELFYGTTIAGAGASTALRTYTKILLGDMVQATQAVNLPWNSLGAQSIAALNPNGSLAGAQVNNMTLDWTQNPSAQQIGSVNAIVNTTTFSFGPGLSVPRGALSVLVDNMTVPAFTPTTSRTLLLNYRMGDGSVKSSTYQYN